MTTSGYWDHTYDDPYGCQGYTFHDAGDDEVYADIISHNEHEHEWVVAEYGPDGNEYDGGIAHSLENAKHDAAEAFHRAVGLPNHTDPESEEDQYGPFLEPVCPICKGELHFVGFYGAPGTGSSWKCDNGHEWSQVGGTFFPPAWQAHILSPEDVI